MLAEIRHVSVVNWDQWTDVIMIIWKHIIFLKRIISSIAEESKWQWRTLQHNFTPSTFATDFHAPTIHFHSYYDLLIENLRLLKSQTQTEGRRERWTEFILHRQIQTDADIQRQIPTDTETRQKRHEQNLSSTDRYINMQTYKYRYRQKAEETDGDNFSCHDLPAWSSSPSCVLVAVIGIVAALVALVTSIVWVIRLSDHGSWPRRPGIRVLHSGTRSADDTKIRADAISWLK